MAGWDCRTRLAADILPVEGVENILGPVHMIAAQDERLGLEDILGAADRTVDYQGMAPGLEVDSPEVENSEVENPVVGSPEADNPEVDSPEVDNSEMDSLGVGSLALRCTGPVHQRVDCLARL